MKVALASVAWVMLVACGEPDCMSACDDLEECRSSDCDADCEETETLSRHAGCDEHLSAWARCIDEADDQCAAQDVGGECQDEAGAFKDCADEYCADRTQAEVTPACNCPASGACFALIPVF